MSFNTPRFYKPPSPSEEAQDRLSYSKWFNADSESETIPLKTRLLRAFRYCIEHDLSEDQRETLLLYLQYNSEQKVAEIKGVNTSTVSRNLRRALKNVGERIKYVDPILYEHDFNIANLANKYKKKKSKGRKRK